MTSTRIFAAATLLALGPLLAACGGSDESSSATTTAAAGESPTTTADGSGGSTTTAASGGGSGSSTEFCSLSDQLDSTVFSSDLSPGQQFSAEQKELFEQVKAAAPDEISDSVTLILDTYAEKGVDPAMFSDPALSSAGQELEQYISANCEGGPSGRADDTGRADDMGGADDIGDMGGMDDGN